MIFRNLDSLTRNTEEFLLSLLLILGGLVVCLTVHEFSHALVATRLGDRHPKSMGRLTLNPLAHLDPLGGLMLLLVGFGWAKPVPVNPLALGGNPLRGMAIVAFAGPLSNTLMAALLCIPFKAGVVDWPYTTLAFLQSPTEQLIATVLFILIMLNLLLAVFNLIPVAPLDGSKAILGLLPRNLAESFRRLEPWGPGVLLTVIMLDWFANTRILIRIIRPAVNTLSDLMVGHNVF